MALAGTTAGRFADTPIPDAAQRRVTFAARRCARVRHDGGLDAREGLF